MLAHNDNIQAAMLVRELRGWAKNEVKAGMAECLLEAAEVLEKFIKERQEMEQYITEREWLHREG